MTIEQFEQTLGRLCEALNTLLGKGVRFTESKEFENKVREVIRDLRTGFEVDFSPHPYVFPDIVMGEFGIEVKFTTNDTWRSVANSVFEGTRKAGVLYVYIIFGKMGNKPEVSWGRYEECVIHVRTSHVPRFEVEVPPQGQYPARASLFNLFGIKYSAFAGLPDNEKMKYVRQYAKNRLKPGEHLWWISDEAEPNDGLQLQVRLYMHLEEHTKRRIRAEAALLCPQVCGGSRVRNKYNDAVMYILTVHGVLCPQARDLFSAGSVAGPTRGGLYLQRALADIENEMKRAAVDLVPALFKEYWKMDNPPVAPEERLRQWLLKADEYAAGHWIPSDHLFSNVTRR